MFTQQQLDVDEYFNHASTIKTALFHPEDPTTLITAGGPEGIYIWSFQGDVSYPNEADQSETFKFDFTQKKAPESQIKKIEAKLKDIKIIEEEKSIRIAKESDNSVRVSSSLAMELRIEGEEQLIKSKVQKSIRESHKKQELNLPSKHYLIEKEDVLIGNPFEDKEAIIKSEIIIGYNGNSHDNIVWNEKEGWIAYTIRNKLVIEDVRERRHAIFSDHESDISTMAISADISLLATAAGTSNPNTKTSDIFVYSIQKNQLQLKKKLSFHETGVQAVKFLCEKYLCSLGRYPECVVALWDIEKGQIIASGKIEYAANDLKGNAEKLSDPFYTVGSNVITEWQFKDGIKPKLGKETIKYTENYTFSCLAQTLYIKSEESCLFLIGTTIGSVIIYNPNKKKFLGDYQVFDGEISCIVVTAKAIVISGTSDTVLRWELPNIETLHPNFFAQAQKLLQLIHM